MEKNNQNNQNNESNQDNTMNGLDFNLDNNLSTDSLTEKSSVNDSASIKASNSTMSNASSLLELDIDESLLEQFNNPIPEPATELKQQGSSQVNSTDSNPLELDFDLQAELPDIPPSKPQFDLNSDGSNQKFDFDMTVNDNLGDGNNSKNIDQPNGLGSGLELSLVNDEPPLQQNDSGIQSDLNVQPNNSGLFNLPNDESANTGQHLGQSVGVIKSRPPEENLYAASNKMDVEDYGDFEIGNDSTWYNLSGRIGRLRYISYVFFINSLMYLVAVILAGIAAAIGVSDMFTAFFIVIIVLAFTIVSGIIYPIRRLNDLGHTGWFCLIGFIPIINIFLHLYLIFAPGNNGFNTYGEPPRENQWYHWVVGIIMPFGFIALIGIFSAIAIPAYEDYTEKSGAVNMEELDY